MGKDGLNRGQTPDLVERVFEAGLLGIVATQLIQGVRGQGLKPVHQVVEGLRMVTAGMLDWIHGLRLPWVARHTRAKYQRSGNHRKSLRKRLKRCGKWISKCPLRQPSSMA